MSQMTEVAAEAAAALPVAGDQKHLYHVSQLTVKFFHVHV